MADNQKTTAGTSAGMSMTEVFTAHRIREDLSCTCTFDVLVAGMWEEHLSSELAAAGVPFGELPAVDFESGPEAVMKQVDARLALAVALADPEGHALVAAIHQRLSARA